MLTRIAMLAAVLGLCVPGGVQAGEILVRADRDHLVQGESALITITVRGSTVRPLVTPPTIPYCRVEQVQEMQLRSRTPERGVAKSSAPATVGMARAFDDLNRQVQDLPGQLSKQGFGDAGLLHEYEGMLHDIRRQAHEALQSGASSGPGEYQAIFRVTPQRIGELTLTPFILKIGGSSYLTKQLTMTIDPAPPKADKAVAATSGSEQSTAADSGVPAVGERGLSLKTWHGLVALLAAPILGAVIALMARRRRPASSASARNRSLQSQARRQTLSQLQAAVDLPTVAETLSDYVRQRCRLPEGEITPEEAAGSLRTAGVSETLADRVATILDTCAAARFAAGGIAVDEREVADDARRVILELER